VQVSFIYNRSLYYRYRSLLYIIHRSLLYIIGLFTPIPGLSTLSLGLDILVELERDRLQVPAARSGLVFVLVNHQQGLFSYSHIAFFCFFFSLTALPGLFVLCWGGGERERDMGVALDTDVAARAGLC